MASLAIAVFAMVAAGCAGDGTNAAANSKNSAASSGGAGAGPRTRSNIADGEYYADAWLTSRGFDQVDPALLPQQNAPIVRNSRGVPLGAGSAGAGGRGAPANVQSSGLPAPAGAGLGMSGAIIDPSRAPPLPSELDQERAAGVWSLVLATFTEGDSAAAAKRMISETANIAPDVRDLRVHPSARGSMVVFGAYPSRDDPKADQDKKWLKSIRHQDRPVFANVMLAHLDLRPLQADLHPFDLHMARREHPKINPLYTLDIAVWDDFGSGKLPYDEIRRSAERYAKQLRMQGFEAYFFHDDVAKRSMVTVGLFDRRAINEVSGLYTDAVGEVVKRFPQRLANGEPMFEYKDRFRPEMGAKPQSPVLVLVPDM